MKHFGSTSPSYLIMLSGDMLLLRWDELRGQYHSLADKVCTVRQQAIQKGVWAAGNDTLRDPLRITLLFPEGWREQAKKLVCSLSMEAEYISPRHIVFLPSPQSRLEAVSRLIQALPPLCEQPSFLEIPLPERVMSVRKAALSPAETVSVEGAVGRIASNPSAPCPPGAALVMPGELIDDIAAAALLRHGVREVSVVKNAVKG